MTRKTTRRRQSGTDDDKESHSAALVETARCSVWCYRRRGRGRARAGLALEFATVAHHCLSCSDVFQIIALRDDFFQIMWLDLRHHRIIVGAGVAKLSIQFRKHHFII